MLFLTQEGGFVDAGSVDKAAASSEGRSQLALDAGRPVLVECFAFAPPPVFSGKGSADVADMYSFVNG